MTANEQSGDDANERDPRKQEPRIKIPPKKTFVAKRLNPVLRYAPTFVAEADRIQEVVVEAHKIEYDAPNVVAFIDLVMTPEGPAIDTHRVLFDVFDIEEVIRRNDQPTTVN